MTKSPKKKAVEIPEVLVKQLPGRRFIQVYSQEQKHPDPHERWEKRPVGTKWNAPQNIMPADDPKLQTWLREGGNYGVVGGFGLIIIDTDTEELKQLAKEQLPPTFTVQSPGSKGWHLYYWCSLEKPIRLRDKESENIGDIQGPNKMVVGPHSVHPNGEIYEIIDDRPLAQVTRDELIETFKEYVVPDKEIQAIELATQQERKRTDLVLDILQVAPLAGLTQRGDEYQGGHPVHGSTGGQNFSVNRSKNCWHCYRHGTGGGPFFWIAVEEGILDCAEAIPGALDGDIFKQVLNKARERGFITQEQAQTQFDKEKKATIIDRIIKRVVKSNITFFEDEMGEACALLDVGGHQEVHLVEGKSFARWIRKKHFEKRGKGLRKDSITEVTATLAAMAQFQKPKLRRKLHNRVAWHEGAIYYDLADENWRALKITPQGWEVVENPPPLFRRFSHQQAQVLPKEADCSALDLLPPLINLGGEEQLDDQLLLKVYSVTAFVPDIPHPILLVLGPQGCGKSFFMRVLRQLLDPSAIMLQFFSYDQLEMALRLWHHYVIYFDNLSSVSGWLSDILCRACTGEGFTKRKLYTDQETVILQFQRCIGINGIALGRLKPDLLDRTLMITLMQIAKDKRKHEMALWQEFEQEKPRILGAILTVLSKAMGIYASINIAELPRMADFVVWGEAVARALGYKPDVFLNTYKKKIGEQVLDILEEHPIGAAILAFMKDKDQWEGGPGELLALLEEETFVEENNIDRAAKLWPGSASWVTRRLKEIETNLEHEHIVFTTSRVRGKRVIFLEKKLFDSMTGMTAFLPTLGSKLPPPPEKVPPQKHDLDDSNVSRCTSCGDTFPMAILQPNPYDSQGTYCPDCLNKLTPAPPPALVPKPVTKHEAVPQAPTGTEIKKPPEEPPSEPIRTSRGAEVSSRAEIVHNVLHKFQGLSLKKLCDKMRPERFSKAEVLTCLASLEKQQKVFRTGKTWKVIK